MTLQGDSPLRRRTLRQRAGLPTLEDHIRRGTVAAFFNLGAAQEASVVQQACNAESGQQVQAGGRGGRIRRKSIGGMRASSDSMGAFKTQRDAQHCFTQALSHDPAHGPSIVGLASLLLRKHRPREALNTLNHEALRELPLAAINRGVVMRELDDTKEGLMNARREMERALSDQSYENSVVAKFNLAQLNMMLGDWCDPLKDLQALDHIKPKRIDSAAAAVDGTQESERAWIDGQLEPLLQACRKWQTCLQIAVADFRSCASLLQPQIDFTQPSTDVVFVPHPSKKDGDDGNNNSSSFTTGGASQLDGPPLSPAQLTLLESLITQSIREEEAGTAPPPPTVVRSRRPSCEGSDAGSSRASSPGLGRMTQAREAKKVATEGIDAPAIRLPSNLPAVTLRRVISLQKELKFQQAERTLEGALRALLPPSSKILGAVGALLFTWRARSRLAVGKRMEAADDYKTALAHVGADGINGGAPPPEIAEGLEEQDARTSAESTAAAVEALKALRDEAAEAVEAAEAAAERAASAAEEAEAAKEGLARRRRQKRQRWRRRRQRRRRRRQRRRRPLLATRL